MQNDAQKRTVDLQRPVVFDEAKLPELVHEEADARPRRPNHLGKRLLTDPCGNGLRLPLLAEIREQQERARQALFTRIEQVVHEVRFNAAVAGQQMRCEQFGESRFGMKDANHLRFVEANHRRLGHGSGGREPQGLPNQAAFAEKVPLAQQGDHRFLSLLGGDDDLDSALHDVKDGVRDVSLRENDPLCPIRGHSSPTAHGPKEHVRIKRGACGFPCHGSLPAPLIQPELHRSRRSIGPYLGEHVRPATAR